MNRRRFLAVLGLAPVALRALPEASSVPGTRWLITDAGPSYEFKHTPRVRSGLPSPTWRQLQRQSEVIEMFHATNEILAELPWKRS